MEEHMKKLYLDCTGLSGAIGVSVPDAEIALAGTTIHSLSVRDRNEEYQRFADDYDIHFIFEDAIPEISFYSVPSLEILANDSKEGFIARTNDEAVLYINQNLDCFLIANSWEEFLENKLSWPSNMTPYNGLTFYQSKEDAEKDLDFIDLRELEIK